MPSNINPYSVDGTFPIAGQDNSSQGFRDNFTNIKSNFVYAQSEISDLQSKAIVTSALTGQTFNNDMAGTQIRRPQLASWTQSLLDLGACAGATILNFNLANFQKITTASSVSLSFSNWPSTVGTGALGYGVMRVWIVVVNAAHTVQLPSSVTIAVNDIAGYNASTRTITFDSAGNYLFDFSSIDGGSNYQIFDLSRNRASFRDHDIYFNPEVSPTLLINYGTAFQNALALEGGQNAVSAKGSYTSAAVGNLALANTGNAQIDTGYVGGYTIVGSRGNLTANTFTPVNNNDYLGYVNAVHNTGYQGTANTFQQSASMVFYSTGSNVTYGLGGNIAFFTAKDGDGNADINKVYQAVGIENDQSVTGYGNVTVAGNLRITGGRINTDYLYLTRTTGATLTANVLYETYYLDSTSSATLAAQTISVPSGAEDGRQLEFNALCPITTTTWTGGTIKYVPSNVFSAGNVSVKLQYSTTASAWLRR